MSSNESPLDKIIRLAAAAGLAKGAPVQVRSYTKTSTTGKTVKVSSATRGAPGGSGKLAVNNPGGALRSSLSTARQSSYAGAEVAAAMGSTTPVTIGSGGQLGRKALPSSSYTAAPGPTPAISSGALKAEAAAAAAGAAAQQAAATASNKLAAAQTAATAAAAKSSAAVTAATTAATTKAVSSSSTNPSTKATSSTSSSTSTTQATSAKSTTSTTGSTTSSTASTAAKPASAASSTATKAAATPTSTASKATTPASSSSSSGSKLSSLTKMLKLPHGGGGGHNLIRGNGRGRGFYAARSALMNHKGNGSSSAKKDVEKDTSKEEAAAKKGLAAAERYRHTHSKGSHSVGSEFHNMLANDTKKAAQKVGEDTKKLVKASSMFDTTVFEMQKELNDLGYSLQCTGIVDEATLVVLLELYGE